MVLLFRRAILDMGRATLGHELVLEIGLHYPLAGMGSPNVTRGGLACVS